MGANADNSVLLSGYAPPAAGDQAILGPAPSAPASATASGAKANARRLMPLAQPASEVSVVSRRVQATVRQSRAGASHQRGARAGAKAPRTPHAGAPASNASLASAPPAVVAAAAQGSAQDIFSWWQAALVGALTLITFGLAHGWRRGIE